MIGVAQADAAIPTSSGDVNVNLLTGVFKFGVHATRPPTIADVGKAVYASDDQTVSNDATDGPIAGTLVGFETGSGAALVEIKPADASAVGLASKEIPVYPSTLVAGTPMAAFADNAGTR